MIFSSGNVNVVSVSGGGRSSPTKVSITVPKGTEVNAQDIDGKIREGYLGLTVSFGPVTPARVVGILWGS